MVNAWSQTPSLEIRNVLEAQVEAWNRGDIEGYMQGYCPAAGGTTALSF